jgi:hypothetical protein
VDATTIPEPDPGPPRAPRPERELYRRRQRRRGIIAWSVAAFVLVLVGLLVSFGRIEKHTSTTRVVSSFSYEMTSVQYEALHKGQGHALVLRDLGSTGMQETEGAEIGLPQLFPAPPSASVCSYWKLSDAPDHLVRLCFSKPRDVLLQKTVEALDGGDAPTTLV